MRHQLSISLAIGCVVVSTHTHLDHIGRFVHRHQQTGTTILTEILSPRAAILEAGRPVHCMDHRGELTGATWSSLTIIPMFIVASESMYLSTTFMIPLRKLSARVLLDSTQMVVQMPPGAAIAAPSGNSATKGPAVRLVQLEHTQLRRAQRPAQIAMQVLTVPLQPPLAIVVLRASIQQAQRQLVHPAQRGLTAQQQDQRRVLSAMGASIRAHSAKPLAMTVTQEKCPVTVPPAVLYAFLAFIQPEPDKHHLARAASRVPIRQVLAPRNA